MKKISALIIAICMLMGFCSCGEKAPQNAVEQIQKNGYLNIPAKDIYSETEQIIAQRIADKLGVDLVCTGGALDMNFGLNAEDKMDELLMSGPYRKERMQTESKEFQPLASHNDYFYCIGIENTEFNESLMTVVNEAITECFNENLIPSLETKDGSIGTPDRSKEYIYESHTEFTPVNYNSPKVLGISEDMGLEYQDKLIIVCDSPNYWMKTFGILSGGTHTKQIWTGPEGTQTFPYYKGYKLYDPNDGSAKVLVELARTYQPEIMVIALGVNGIAKKTEETFSSKYNEMISDLKEACPNTTFVLASIYPVAEHYKNMSIINNELITAGNSWILKTAEEYDCFYLDIFSVLIGDDGFAKKELMQSDGLHPNKEGLTRVLEYIRTHACIQ